MLHLQHLQNLCKTHLSNEKLIFIQVKTIAIKIINHLRVYNLISTVV